MREGKRTAGERERERKKKCQTKSETEPKGNFFHFFQTVSHSSVETTTFPVTA